MLHYPFSPFATHHTGRFRHANAADLAYSEGLPRVPFSSEALLPAMIPFPESALGSVLTSGGTRAARCARHGLPEQNPC